jgi:uncharacterized protein
MAPTPQISIALSQKEGTPTRNTNLAALYAKGEGVPQDFAESVRWLRLAPEQGHLEAQFISG